jgi:large subunit ribosomal protein L6
MSTEGVPSVAVPLPKGVRVRLEDGSVIAEGPKGKVSRPFPVNVLDLSVGKEGLRLTLKLPARKRTGALVGTWKSHLANLVVGVERGFEARAKGVAAHFPMKLSSRDGEVLIENFLGEKHPRRSLLVGGTTATVQGEEVHLEGPDLEAVGQSAANLERATHIRNYDPRVFQDGIYITQKPRPKEAA